MLRRELAQVQLSLQPFLLVLWGVDVVALVAGLGFHLEMDLYSFCSDTLGWRSGELCSLDRRFVPITNSYGVWTCLCFLLTYMVQLDIISAL